MHRVALQKFADQSRIVHFETHLRRILYAAGGHVFVGAVRCDGPDHNAIATAILAEREQMFESGVFLVTFFDPERGRLLRISIEKYLVRRRTLMNKYGYRLGFEDLDKGHLGFIVSGFLPDLVS